MWGVYITCYGAGVSEDGTSEVAFKQDCQKRLGSSYLEMRQYFYRLSESMSVEMGV